MKAIILGAVVAIAAIGSALADDLPAGAVPLTSDEVTKIYSGKTAFYKVSTIYYAPDGTMKGVFGGKSPFKGTWTVASNEQCQVSGNPGEKQYKDCNKYWRAGKKIWSLWTVHYDDTPVDEHGYWDKQVQQFKPGDQVSKLYRKVGGT